MFKAHVYAEWQYVIAIGVAINEDDPERTFVGQVFDYDDVQLEGGDTVPIFQTFGEDTQTVVTRIAEAILNVHDEEDAASGGNG